MAFGSIERGICFAKQHTKVRCFSTLEASNAEACRHSNGFSVDIEHLPFDLLPNSLDRDPHASAITMPYHLHKLLAPDPSAHIGGACICLQNGSKSFEHHIPDIVTVTIIDALETIEIGHDYPEWETMPGSGAQLSYRPRLEGPPIRKPGQSVGERQFFKKFVFGLN